MADFDFSLTFTGTAVQPVFHPLFAHDDWFDGISTIQAEPNGAEKGFNVRFHEIETDLAALGRDGATSLDALTATRQELLTLLGDIKDELTRLGRPLATVWQTVTPAAGWSPAPAAPGTTLNPLRHLIDRSKMVHLQGALTSTAAASDAGLLIGTLPTGARPGNTCVFAACSGAGTTRVEVRRTGEITAKGAYNGFLSVDGLHFAAEG